MFVMTPPNERTSEGGRDDRGVPYHAESTLSSAQVLNTGGKSSKKSSRRAQSRSVQTRAAVVGGRRSLSVLVGERCPTGI